ncbi:MAG TPA: PIG-L deacetylase family protein [Steroidobacteraceae bacterium]|nr:PIG-L deacetylase family protein [Steroidobacteraceae bacterium]
MHRAILVVAAHPDDEVLGCGGTIAKLAALGADVSVLFLSDGVTSRLGGDSAAHQVQLDARNAAARRAAEILGVRNLVYGKFPDNRMDTIALLEITRSIEDLIAQIKPDTVLTHHAGDLNVDHRRVHEAVVTACRPQSGHPVRTLLNFEVPSSTEWQLGASAPAFLPNWFEDITTTLERKLAALDAYEAELRAWPHPRSRKAVEHLARWRGATVGAQAAEAFMLGRQLA